MKFCTHVSPCINLFSLLLSPFVVMTTLCLYKVIIGKRVIDIYCFVHGMQIFLQTFKNACFWRCPLLRIVMNFLQKSVLIGFHGNKNIW